MSPSEVPRFYPALPDDALTGVAPTPESARSFARALVGAFDDAGAALDRAAASEHAFATHRTGLQEMVLDRAQADVALALASAAATRTAQALTTVLGMQV